MHVIIIYLIEVTAQVVPIRREDYYYGISDTEENNLVGSSKLDNDDDKELNVLSTTANKSRKKKFGTKLLRDRHGNLVHIYNTLLEHFIQSECSLRFMLIKTFVCVLKTFRLIEVGYLSVTF